MVKVVSVALSSLPKKMYILQLTFGYVGAVFWLLGTSQRQREDGRSGGAGSEINVIWEDD